MTRESDHRKLADINTELKRMNDEGRALLRGNDAQKNEGERILGSRKYLRLKVEQVQLKHSLGTTSI